MSGGLSGTIGLRALAIDCVVGIYPHEREAPQRLLVDVEVDYDFVSAASSEQVADTIDYDGIASILTHLALHRCYQLIETFAVDGTAALLDHFPQITAARLEIRKPAAVPAAEAAFVRLTRRRGAS